MICGRHVAAWGLLLALAAPAGADEKPAAGEPPAAEYLPTGGDAAVWVIRVFPDAQEYDLIGRRRGQREWMRVGEERSLGRPISAAAVDTRLHLLLGSGNQVYFRLGAGREAAPMLVGGKRLTGVLRLAGAPKGFAEAPRASLLAVGFEPVAAGPEAGPAGAGAGEAGADSPAEDNADGAPARARPVIWQNVGAEWRRLDGPAPAGPCAEGDGALLAATPEAAYVLTAPAAGPRRRLLVWRGGAWATRTLPEGLSGEVLALVALNEAPYVLTAVAAEGGEGRALRLWPVGAEADGEEARPILRDGKPRTWPAEALPRATRLGDKLALVWVQKDGPHFAACDASGRLEPPEPLEVYGRPAEAGDGQMILDVFRWAALAATLVPAFLLRPRKPLRPFALPKGVRPGGLLRRAAALLIDVVPFSLLGTALFVPEAFGAQPQDPDAWWKWVSEQMTTRDAATASVFGLTSYVTYCIAMELRFGATVGKMLLKLRVVGDGATRADLREVVLRNTIKLFIFGTVLLLPLFVVFPVMSRYRQRLGDMFARSCVVDARSRPVEPNDEQTGQPGPAGPSREPPGAGDDDRPGRNNEPPRGRS